MKCWWIRIQYCRPYPCYGINCKIFEDSRLEYFHRNVEVQDRSISSDVEKEFRLEFQRSFRKLWKLSIKDNNLIARKLFWEILRSDAIKHFCHVCDRNVEFSMSSFTVSIDPLLSLDAHSRVLYSNKVIQWKFLNENFDYKTPTIRNTEFSHIFQQSIVTMTECCLG